MYITQCVLAFLSLHAGLAHSFSWEIVIRMFSRLDFYDMNGTLTHSEKVSSGYIKTVTYDPVHNRVLFTDRNHIYSFKIASKTIETIITTTNSSINSLAYDPATELLFWNEDFMRINAISLKTGFNNRTTEKQLILANDFYPTTAVDICGGFIYWNSGDLNIHRSRFDGSERETITGVVDSIDYKIDIDQLTQKIYWYDGVFKSIKCADLNGTNTREIYQVQQLRSDQDIHLFTFTKDHIFLKICNIGNCSIWRIPRNASSDIDPLTESNLFIKHDVDLIWGIAARYSIEDLIRGVQNCQRLKSLLPNYSVAKGCSDVSLLCLPGRSNRRSKSRRLK